MSHTSMLREGDTVDVLQSQIGYLFRGALAVVLFAVFSVVITLRAILFCLISFAVLTLFLLGLIATMFMLVFSRKRGFLAAWTGLLQAIFFSSLRLSGSGLSQEWPSAKAMTMYTIAQMSVFYAGYQLHGYLPTTVVDLPLYGSYELGTMLLSEVCFYTIPAYLFSVFVAKGLYWITGPVRALRAVEETEQQDENPTAQFKLATRDYEYGHSFERVYEDPIDNARMHLLYLRDGEPAAKYFGIENSNKRRNVRPDALKSSNTGYVGRDYTTHDTIPTFFQSSPAPKGVGRKVVGRSQAYEDFLRDIAASPSAKEEPEHQPVKVQSAISQLGGFFKKRQNYSHVFLEEVGYEDDGAYLFDDFDSALTALGEISDEGVILRVYVVANEGGIEKTSQKIVGNINEIREVLEGADDKVNS